MDRQRRTPAPPSTATEQLSRSGTPRYFQGETIPDDYVTALTSPEKRMAIFEEMRASDGAVNTAITAREQLIHSANWQLTSPDETPAGKQILEFVEDNVYPFLEDLLRSLAGALQYGVGLCEPVFQWSDAPTVQTVAYGKMRRPVAPSSGRKLYLAKVARIRQRTVRSFILGASGELEIVRQWVPVWGSALAMNDVPASKLLIWTYNQQGDDYWGVPPTRSAYKAWTFKQQLEKITLLGADRFGAGTPVAIGGQDWGDAEYTSAQQYLAAWRAGANSGLTLPFGGSVDLKGGDAGLFTALQDLIAWYTLEIAKTWLTQGTELGSTQTGSRAVGQTMYDQMESVVQADCEQIASILNEKLIVPLVQWNFGSQESYPMFNPSQKVRQSAAIGEVIQYLLNTSPPAVKWSAEDEQWLRDALQMPDIDVAARQAEMDATAAEKQAQADALKERLAGANGGDGTGQDGQGPQQDPQQTQDPPGGNPPPEKDPLAMTRGRGSDRMVGGRGEGDRRAPRALAASLAVPDPAPAGTTHRTADYTAWEQRVVKPDVLARTMDLHAVRLTAEVQDVLHAIDANLTSQVRALALGGAAVLAKGVGDIAVPQRLVKQLRAVMLDAAERARAAGSAAVHTEILRQTTPDIAAPQRGTPGAIAPFSALVRTIGRLWALATAADGTPASDAADAQLTAAVERAVQDEIDRREGSARGAALAALAAAGVAAGATLAEVAQARAAGALEELSPARTQDTVNGVINAGFGIGRGDAATAIAAEDPERLVAKVYSAVMDTGTCDACAQWDGAQFPIDYDETAPGNVKAPNPQCAGTLSRCRCIWTYITAQEAPSLVGPTRGPEAIA